MLITSCGCDIVAGETTDPTNAPWRKGRSARTIGRWASGPGWQAGRMAAVGERVRSPCMCISEGTEFPENSSSIKRALCYAMPTLFLLPNFMLPNKKKKEEHSPNPIFSNQPHT